MAAEPDPPTQLPRATMQPDEPPHLVRISREVFAAELREIVASRERRFAKEQAGDEAPKRELERVRNLGGPTVVPTSCGLVGLALSGGGIRSAAFCLGVLQSLARDNKLRLVDYLSTVSGGGYIGSSWSALLAGSEDWDVQEPPDFPFVHVAKRRMGQREFVEHQRYQQGREPIALVHLRDFANYLMPRGLRDQLRVPVLLLRGIIINLLVILPALLLFAAVTLLLYGEVMKKAEVSALPGFVATPWLFGLSIVVLLGATLWQKWRPRWLDSELSWRARRSLLDFGSVVFLSLLLVAFIEAQQYAIWFLMHRGDEAVGILTRPDLWSGLAAVGGMVSALFAGQAAASKSPLVRQTAFVLVGLLGPLALWLLYLYLCRWAVSEFSYPPLFLIVAAAALFAVMTLIVDINRTSLHNFYRDRLSRAFMIKVQREGQPEKQGEAPGWRIRHEDEVKLSEVRPVKTRGPYHLINAVVNSPDFGEEGRLGDESQRGRRGDFFIFAPSFCGNERLGYCKTQDLEEIDQHMNLATATAISAAAAAPNMGQQTPNALVVFLMAMLNVRLGYWLRRPDLVDKKFRRPVGPIYFLKELIGLSVASSAYINVTDGGHLENLGIFELLRRRCRYIIAIDAEADPEISFNGLAILQRLAHTDLGVDIHFDVEDLRKDTNGLSRRHFALCKIDYPDGEQGELLYVKSSVTGTEVEYIKEYQRRHSDFPHETTGDQFFDEAQFEAYRALGHQIGNELVGNPYSPSLDRHEREAQTAADTADAFFAQVREWLRPAAPFREDFLNLAGLRRQINEVLHEPSFRDYLREIHEDLVVEPSRITTQTQSGLHDDRRDFDRPTYNWEAHEQEIRMLRLVDEQMQMMEHALFALHLDQRANQEHPRNRGLMNLFRSWSQAPTFHQYWALQISFYSDSLQSFGKYALGLDWKIGWRRAEHLTDAENKIVDEYINDECKKRIADKYRNRFRRECKLQVLIPRHAIVLAAPPSIDETPTGLATVVALSVVFELDEHQYLLVAFRIRDTYRSLRLSEPLLYKLADVLRPDSKEDLWPEQEPKPILYDLSGLGLMGRTRAGWNASSPGWTRTRSSRPDRAECSRAVRQRGQQFRQGIVCS